MNKPKRNIGCAGFDPFIDGYKTSDSEQPIAVGQAYIYAMRPDRLSSQNFAPKCRRCRKWQIGFFVMLAVSILLLLVLITSKL